MTEVPAMITHSCGFGTRIVALSLVLLREAVTLHYLLLLSHRSSREQAV
jgi:hypothetical protein